MLHHLVTALTSKAAIAAGAVALAAATATAAPALVADSRSADVEHEVLEQEVLENENETEGAEHGARPDAQAAAGEGAAQAGRVHGDDEAESLDEPADAHAEDSFGAVVSADAQDGGVNGEEISRLARERNDARRAERTQHGHGEDESETEVEDETETENQVESESETEADHGRGGDRSPGGADHPGHGRGGDDVQEG